MPRGRPRLYTPQQNIIRKLHSNIWYRCNYPGTNKFEYYGGAGIQCNITIEELTELWERDSAHLLIKPSIDRIEAVGNYDKANCRFIELDRNRITRQFKQCTNCPHRLYISSKYDVCYKCRTNSTCGKCGSLYKRSQKNQRLCQNCSTSTKPCYVCGRSITRPNLSEFINRNPGWRGRWRCLEREGGHLANKLSFYEVD